MASLRHRPGPRASALVPLCAALSAAVLASPSAVSAQDGGNATGAPPALGVLVVVDQLPAFLLERYGELFTGGIRRLLDEGRVFAAATHDHLVTETAPGHASLATGTHPSRHGVVSNFWYERRDGGWTGVENVLAPDHPVVGRPDLTGATPEVLERAGLADWLLGERDGSRVVSLSGKPRGAVLLGPRDPGHVYWYEAAAGGFVTSGWYRDALPDWVADFNRGALQAFRDDTVWISTVPPDAATLSRPDTAAFEGEGPMSHFPHSWGKAREAWGNVGFWSWFAVTPHLDRATLDLARRAVRAEGLGSDEVPDLLTLSLSQTDGVGHQFGPLSREQLDNLLRLDAALGDFMAWLDREVGEGRWVLAFSSDHGGQVVPEWEAREVGDRALRLGDVHMAEMQEAVNRAAREAGTTDPDELSEPVAEEVAALPWVARTWTHEELAEGEPADSFEVLARNSHYPGRPSGLLGRLGVTYMVAPHVLPLGYPTGSTHQSGYLHDRHVPLIFLGAGVEPGVEREGVATVDLAPTLADLLGVRRPDDLDGRTLTPGR